VKDLHLHVQVLPFASLEGRRCAQDDMVGCPPFVTYAAKFRDPFRTGDQRRLIAKQLTAYSVSALASELTAQPAPTPQPRPGDPSFNPTVD
jgi:hypothetical protein